jgi:two-component system, NtrC family, sensor kinase
MTKSRSPLLFLGVVGLWVFSAEFFVMFILSIVPRIHDQNVEALVDSFLLSILIAPALYQFIYRPLKEENQERQQIEQQLRQSSEKLQDYSQNLEQKVYDRTQELNAKNHELKSLLEQFQTTQLQMIQSEKMSALGQMVAGIAHEINNPVSFIHGNLSYMTEYIQNLLKLIDLYQKYTPHAIAEIEATQKAIDLEFLQEDLPKLLQSMAIGTDRIREIVLSLRNFSRLDEEGYKVVDLHDGIDSTLMILGHRLKATHEHPAIVIIREYGELPLIECYPGLLNQVLMNILVNAIDALEEKSVQLSYQAQVKHPGQIKIFTSRLNDQSIQISITDNGYGMPDSVRSKIFDPFFTTKPIGKGTGMGMAISYQLITEKHSGRLDCISKLGHGTEFRIQLPINQTRIKSILPSK